MANALQYIANLGKSVTYSAIDKVKDMNPVVTEFAERNSELGKILYESIKDFKGTSIKLRDIALKSKVGEFAIEYKKAFFEDLKSGKFYNREREERMQIRASGDLLNFDVGDPFAELESGDSSDVDGFDFGDSDKDWDIGADDEFLADQIDKVGEKTANAIAYATGRSAEYIVASNKQAVSALQKHNEYLVGKISIGIGAVNSSISNLMQFNQQVVKPYVDTSIKFFNDSIALDKERNELLKKLVEHQTNLYKVVTEERKKGGLVTYDDIVGANGMPDLKQYFKRVMQNVNNASSGYLDMASMFEGGNLLLAFAGSPLKFVTDTIVKKLTPKAVERAMMGLNETLSGFFSSLLSKFNTMKDDEQRGPISRFLARILGIDDSLKTKIDVSKYHRGPIPFDGETKMAITQVIPMHLAKIEAALTGRTERMFDYKKGSFVNLDDIKKEYEDITKSYAEGASKEIRREMEELLKKNIITSKYDRDALNRSMSNMFLRAYQEGKLIDLNNKDFNYWEWGIEDPKSFEIIRALFKTLDRSTKMKYNKYVWENRARQRRHFEQEELDPTSIYRLLENGFNIDEYTNKKDGKYLKPHDIKIDDNRNPALQNNLVLLRDNKGHNMYYYLQRLTEDVEKIRFVLLSDFSGGPGGGKRKGKTNRYNTINNSIIGIPYADNFKTYADIVRSLEDQEQKDYLREAERLKRRHTIFDPTINGGKRLSVEDFIKRERYIQQTLGIYDEREFNETIVKNAEKLTEEFNSKHMIMDGRLFFDDDYSDLSDEEYGKAYLSHLKANKAESKAIDEINESVARLKKNSLGNRIKNKLEQSGGIGNKLYNLLRSLDEFAQKPIKVIAGIFQRVDERLYEAIYGSDDDREKLSPKSFMGALLAKMTSLFNNFGTILKENIINPIKEVILGEKAKEQAKKFMNWVKFDPEKMKERANQFILGDYEKDENGNIVRDEKGRPVRKTKGMFGGAIDFTKKSFAEVWYSPTMDKLRDYIKGEEKEAYKYYKERIDRENENKLRWAQELAEGFGIGQKVDKKYAGRMRFARRYAERLGLDPDSLDEATLRSMGRYIERVNPGIVDEYAKGSKLIKKTGLAVLSEGEMVIPSELNPFYKKKTDKEEQIKKEQNIKNRFLKLFGVRRDIPTLNEGTDSFDPSTGTMNPKDDIKVSKRNRELNGVEFDESYIDPKEKYKEGKDPFSAKVLHVGRNATNKVLKRLGLYGRDFRDKMSLKLYKVGQRLDDLAGDEDSDDLFKEAVKDVTSDFTKYLPGVLGGGLIGGGISLITGLVGGPLLGAAVGAATGIITQSEKVKTWLFGKEVDGERTGNVISKELANNIEKYLPNMAKGATVGGILSILPFVPGGPVSGIILGSAIGFATKSEKMQEFLFGSLDPTDPEGKRRLNNGLIKQTFIKKLKDAAPEMALGAIGGAIAGPFGLLGNIALGATLGYASKTKEFQEFIFGKYNEETGEHEGGLLGTIKTKFIDPLVNSVQPIAKQMELGVKSMFDKVSNLFHGIFDEELRIPLRKFFKERIFDRAVGLTKKVGGVILNPAISVASSPFRLVGAIGEHLRARQIAQGNATYMTAQERLDYREAKREKGARKLFGRTFRRGRLKNDDFEQFDQYLVDMNTEDLDSISAALEFLENPDEKASTLRRDSISALTKAINYDYGLDYKTSKAILKELKEGNIEGAHAIVRRSNLDQASQQRLSMLINTNYADYETANQLLSDSKRARQYIFDKLREKGLKQIDDSTIGKYKKLVDQELQVKRNQTPEEWMNEREQERHEEIVSLFKDLIDTIKIVSNPNSPEADEIRTNLFNRNLKESLKKRGAVSILDRGDSRLYGNYRFKYINGVLYRYTEEDENGDPIDPVEIDKNTMLPKNGAAFGFGDFDDNYEPYTKEEKIKRGVISRIKGIGSTIWNTKIFDKINQKRIQKLADKNKEIAMVSGEVTDEEDIEVVYKSDLFGNPIKWVKDRSGRWYKDDSDSLNKEAEEQTNPLKKGFNWITEKIGNLAADIKDGIFRLFHINEDDGTVKKIAKFALGGLGILTVAGAANLLEGWWKTTAIPAIANFWQDKIYPKIAKFIEPIKPAIARAAVGIDKVISSIPNAIQNLGNRIKTFITEDLPRIWSQKIIPFYKGGIDWLANKVEKVAEGASYLIIKLLPSVAKGVIKGAWNMLKTEIFNLFGGFGRLDSKSLLRRYGSSNVASSGFKVPKSINKVASSSPMQNIYRSIFGTSAMQDAGYETSEPISDKQLESYYNLETDTYPRNSSNGTGIFSRIKDGVSRASTSISNFFKGSSNSSSMNISGTEDYSGYAERVVNSAVPPVNNTVAQMYDNEVKTINQSIKNTSKNTVTSSNIYDTIMNKTGIGANYPTYDEETGIITDTYGNAYIDNGDETVTSLDTGEVLSIYDIVAPFTSNATQAGKSVLGEFSKYSIGTRFLNVLGRAGLTGRVGIFGKLAASKLLQVSKRRPRTIFGWAGRILQTGASKGVNAINKVGNFSKNIILKGIQIDKAAVTKAAKSQVDDVLKAAAKTVEKNGRIFKVFDDGVTRAVEEIAETAGQEGLEILAKQENGIIKKFLKKFDDFTASLYKNKIVTDYTKKALKGAGKATDDAAAKGVLAKVGDAVKNRLKKLVEGITKKSPEKVISVAGKALRILNIAFCIKDFLDGFFNAGTYFGILDEDVTPWQRLICALAQLVNGFLVLGLFPLSIIISIFTDVILPIFGYDNTKLNQKREKAALELSRYNADYGTNYTLEDYNKRTGFIGQLKSKYLPKIPGTDDNRSIIQKAIDSINATSSDYYEIETQNYILEKEASQQSSQSRIQELQARIDQLTNPSSFIDLYSYSPEEVYNYPEIYDSYNYYDYIGQGSGIVEEDRPSLPKIVSSVKLRSMPVQSPKKNKFKDYVAFGSGLVKYSAKGATTATNKNIVEETVYIIALNETTNMNYGQVTINDGGSMSIGKYQYNGVNKGCVNILRKICTGVPDAKNILGKDLYNKFMSASNLKGFIPTKEEARAISELLITDVGIKAQDEQMLADAEKYIHKGISLGIYDPKTLMYLADMIHQCGSGESSAAIKAVRWMKNHYTEYNLDNLHRSVEKGCSEHFKKHKTRRTNTYNLCKQSLVTDIQTPGYAIRNVSVGSAYVEGFLNREDSDQESGTIISRIISKISKLGSHWFSPKSASNDFDTTLGDTVNQNYQIVQHSYELTPEEKTELNQLKSELAVEQIKEITNDPFISPKDKAKAQSDIISNASLQTLLNKDLLNTANEIFPYQRYESIAKSKPIYPKLAQLNFDYNNQLGIYTDTDHKYMTKEHKQLLSLLPKEKINGRESFIYPKDYNDFINLWYEYGPYGANLNSLFTKRFFADATENERDKYPDYLQQYAATREIYEKFKPGENLNSLFATKYTVDFLPKYGEELKKQLEEDKKKYTNTKYIRDYSLNSPLEKTIIDEAIIHTSKRINQRVINEGTPSGAKTDTSTITLSSNGSPTVTEVFDKGKLKYLSANGSGFVSQLDPKYANNKLGNATVAEAGCGPATAAMAIQGLTESAGETDLMNKATALASRYNDKGGTKASYFADIFGRVGARTEYIEGSNKSEIEKNLSEGKQVVLMGRDPSNRTKEKSPFGPGNHYVLAKAMKDGKILVNDPELSGPRVYDKNILNNTKLGIAVSGKGSENKFGIKSIFNTIFDKIKMAGTVFNGGELGDSNVNEDYTSSSTTTKTTPVQTLNGNVANIINYARSFIGKIKYSQERRYDIDKGGEYADCSSFVRHVFAKFGIQLGSYTGSQIYNGKEVSFEELQPGDLVMFKDTSDQAKNRPRRVSHVGIYTGNDMFIHCSSKYGVVEVQLSTSNLYKKHWLCGRRVINSSVSAKGSIIRNIIDNATAKGSNTTTSKAIAPSITKVVSSTSKHTDSSNLTNTMINAQIKPSASASTISDSPSVTNRLLESVVRLLAEMVNNTSNVKDIVGLLTKILEKTESAKGSETVSTKESKTSSKKGTSRSSINDATLEILKRHSQSDVIDMNNLIKDLNSILTE